MPKRRAGWNCERGAAALGLFTRHGEPRATGFSKRVQPALRTVAFLRILDGAATELDLAEAFQSIALEDVAQALRRLAQHDHRKGIGGPMGQREIALRCLLQTGRIDESLLHPTRS